MWPSLGGAPADRPFLRGRVGRTVSSSLDTLQMIEFVATGNAAYVHLRCAQREAEL